MPITKKANLRKIMTTNKKYLCILPCFLLFTSCSEVNNVVYDKYEATNGEWKKEDVKVFVFEVNDTVSTHNIFLNVRVNKNYPYSNMFVIFKIYQPDSSVLADTLQYQMAKPDGTLLGSGFSDLKESKLWLKEDFRFSEQGNYKFTIEQAVRELGQVEGVSSLKGISELGIRIEKK